MKEFIGNAFLLLLYAIFSIGGVLGTIFPFYAAYKDVQADEVFWAIVDVVAVVPGIIRGIMYLLGWL